MRRGVPAVLDPPIETTRPIPKLALLPLFIIWFGIGELSKTIVIIAALFPLISISAMQAVRAVSVPKIQAARSTPAPMALAQGADWDFVPRCRFIYPLLPTPALTG